MLALFIVGCVLGYFAIGSLFVRRVLPRIGLKLWRERVDYVRKHYAHRDVEYYLAERGNNVKTSIIGYAWVLAAAWPFIPFYLLGRVWWKLVYDGFQTAYERNNPANMNADERQKIYHLPPPPDRR